MKFFKIHIITLIFLCLGTIAHSQSHDYEIKQGVLDLSGWDWSSTYALSGEWELYWQHLLTPAQINDTGFKVTPDYNTFPSPWRDLGLANQGHATYRLTISIPKKIKKIALYVPQMFMGNKLWVNGKLLHQNGEVGTDKATSKPQWNPAIVYADIDDGQLELVLQIANYHSDYGGALKPIMVGNQQTIQRYANNNLVYHLLVVGAFIIGFFFLIGLYFFGISSKSSALYLAIYCLMQSYVELSEEALITYTTLIDMPWYLLYSLERIAFLLGLISIFQFGYIVFPKASIKTVTRIAQVLLLFVAIYTAFFPEQYYITYVGSYILLGVFHFPYILFLFIRAILFKEEGGKYILYALILAISVILLSVFTALNLLPDIPSLYFISFAGTLFFLSLIVIKRFTNYLRDVLKAAKIGEKAKENFLATMSHEIRTPMNGVIGMTTLLSSTKLNSDQQKFVEIIRVSGENLITIIDDILDLDKINDGKIKLNPKPFNTESLLEEILDLFASRVNQKKLRLVYLMDIRVPTTLIGDNLRIKQILINLVNNAIKFTPKGGEVCIKISTPEIINNNIILQFDVVDTGIGIPKEKQDQLFQQFSQTDASISRKYGGSGLGLVICERLVEQMNGKIWVTSEQGKGSTFSFTLHLDLPKSPSQDLKAYQAPIDGLEGKKVLLLTASDRLQNILDNFFAPQKAELTTVSSTIDAFKKLKQDQYTLILLDNFFPDATMLDFEQQLRMVKSLKNTGIILLGTNYMEFSKIQPHTFTFFIHNPIKISYFRHVIKNILHKKDKPLLDEGQDIPDNVMLSEVIPLKILIVEDHAINQKLVMMLLKKLGYKADAVDNGVKAVNAVNNKRYDLVLMDVQMPEMDGLEATRRIVAAHPPDYRPKIVAMTANAMPGDREMCLDAGMDDYASKPLKPGIIREIILKWGSKISTQ